MQDYPAGMDDALDGERGAGQREGVILSNVSDTDKQTYSSSAGRFVFDAVYHQREIEFFQSARRFQ